MRIQNPWRHENEYDQVLLSDQRKLERLVRDGRIWKPIMGREDLIAHGMFPEPFIITQSIVTPALGTKEAVILDYTMEFGYRAVITNLGHRYFGTGYVEGASMITWTYFKEYHPLPGFMLLIEQFGDQQRPRPIERGIPVFPGQRIQVKADVNNTVGTGGTNELVATIQGLKYGVR